MKIFEDCKFEKDCPICYTKNKGDAILIGIDETQAGNNIEAELFHVSCLSLIYYSKDNIIAQRF